MDATYQALLRAVITSPEDDAPRLILADYLDDHDQSNRADFIRRQVGAEHRRATCPCGSCVSRRGGGPHHNGPCGIERDFRMTMEQAMPSLHEWVGAPLPANRFRWRRGFIDAAYLDWSNWHAHGDALVAQHPIRRVVFTNQPIIPLKLIRSTTTPDCLIYAIAKPNDPVHAILDQTQMRTLQLVLRHTWSTVQEWFIPPYDQPQELHSASYSSAMAALRMFEARWGLRQPIEERPHGL